MNDDLIRRSDVLRVFYNKEPIVQGEHDGMGMLAHALWRHIREAVEAIPAVEAEPVVHAHWEDMYGGKYANPRYRCSACKEKALYRFKKNGLDQWEEVQSLTPKCSHCGAHMDEEVAE